jgi:hypothetical protein
MNDEIKLLIAFFVIVVLDLLVIGGFFWKAHPNFIEVYKHLK